MLGRGDRGHRRRTEGPAIREGEARWSWRRLRHHEQPAGIPSAEFAVHHDRRDEGGDRLRRRAEARTRHGLGGGSGSARSRKVVKAQAAEAATRRWRPRRRQGARRRGRRGQSPQTGRRLLQVRPELTRARGVSGEDRRPAAASAGTFRIHRGERRRPGGQRRGQVRSRLAQAEGGRRRRKGRLRQRSFPPNRVHRQIDHRVLQPRPRPDSRVRPGR